MNSTFCPFDCWRLTRVHQLCRHVPWIDLHPVYKCSPKAGHASLILDSILYTTLLALWDFHDGLINILSSFLKILILSGKNWFKLPGWPLSEVGSLSLFFLSLFFFLYFSKSFKRLWILYAPVMGTLFKAKFSLTMCFLEHGSH